uniref:Cyclin-dependent protein kinase inhibitor SMR4-like n=1 Tax=Nicotiana tabacum TaxID=4097 RepID=A0A1S3Z2G4_TOBAC|nr:PREDICTED: uncharacterized protein LOC107782280 [Nicotiana tabacum]
MEGVDSDCEVVEEGCMTPRRDTCRIMVNSLCPPPPPKKKRVYVKQQRPPPKEGYFQPPDLELFFAIVRREACA